MELVILGSGTGAVRVERGAPSVWVRAGDASCLVDTGPGSLRQFAAAGGRLDQLGHLLYTHAHLDHVSDLWPLLFTANIPWLEGPELLHLHGSPAFLEFYERVSAAIGRWVEPRRFQVVKKTVTRKPQPLGDATVCGVPVPHIESSVAYRFEHGGKVLVISGDTDMGDGILEAAGGADLLLLECSTPDADKVEGHLTPRLCGEIAARAGVRRLVLTHLYPAVDKVDIVGTVRRAFDGEVQVAQDLRRFVV